MGRLFFKIFCGFWLAMVMGGVLVSLVVVVSGTEPLVARWNAIAGTAMSYYAQTAAETYERDGAAGLRSLFERMEEESDIRAYFFAADGRELSGRTAPERAWMLASRALANGGYVRSFGGNRTLAAQTAAGPFAGRYILVGDLPRGRRGIPGGMRVLLLYASAYLLAISLICYLLARYLTGPIIKLRAGVRRLASGDVRVRVGPEIGRRNDELADLSRDFDVMADRLEKLIQAQRRLLGDISHELRSPLTRLNLSLAIARRVAGPDAAEQLDRIEAEAGRINTLIDQLLMLTRLESGVEEVGEASIDLAQLVEEIAVDADFEARNLKRAVRIIESDECFTTGSHLLLRSAVENVVRNAVRYTAEGTAVEIRLRVEWLGGASTAVISVHDHGPGVPEKALADLFRPFYTVTEARDRKSGGSGLGLAITERAVRLHGGSVEAANAPGGGLIVEIRLPGSEVRSPGAGVRSLKVSMPS
ncbi:MAG: HAMP domain-containing protein [Blastocatellia bacterium]|nr:HAMP domain-containing protein [Blastocatellia bacterium]